MATVQKKRSIHEMLVEAMSGVRDGSLDVPQARAMATLANSVVSIAKIEVSLMKMESTPDAAKKGRILLSLTAK